nr:bifunctional transcriptional activator/dna repair enzyme ada [Quercus suber]
MTDAARWRAVTLRDANYDGCFVYCVKTTRIYCRPVCKARLARRSNVQFRDTAEDAELDGYRACKRCQPQASCTLQPEVERIKRVCKLLDDLPEDVPLPGLETMASQAGLSRHHFHRQFKRIMHMTPRQYAMATRSTSNTRATQSPASCEIAQSQNEIDSEGWKFDSASTEPSPTEKLSCYYAVVDTKYGVLLVAFYQQQVRKIQLCANEFEISIALEQSFPSEVYTCRGVELFDKAVISVY